MLLNLRLPDFVRSLGDFIPDHDIAAVFHVVHLPAALKTDFRCVLHPYIAVEICNLFRAHSDLRTQAKSRLIDHLVAQLVLRKVVVAEPDVGVLVRVRLPDMRHVLAEPVMDLH